LGLCHVEFEDSLHNAGLIALRQLVVKRQAHKAIAHVFSDGTIPLFSAAMPSHHGEMQRQEMKGARYAERVLKCAMRPCRCPAEGMSM